MSKTHKSGSTDVSKYKLPTTVVPRHYRILQAPDFGTFRFRSDVEIDIDVLAPVSEIQLHANGLQVHKAWAVDANGTRLDAVMTTAKVTWFKESTDPETGKPTFEPEEFELPSAATLDSESQRAIFKFNGVLGKGQWKFFAECSGSLVQPSLEGFYLADWNDDEGKRHFIGTTQFEATHARRAFVCFDEPALKATYDVVIEADAHLTVLSNSRVLRVTTSADDASVPAGKKRVEFRTTPKMSTYLLAYCIGEFESSEPVWSSGVEIRVWATPGKKHMMSYALRCAAFGVKWLEDFFGVKYMGGDKMDMIAIPNFRSGAMENVGLITYRATALLADEKKATIAELKRVAEVVFHEWVHQWCGNWVTMGWWDGLPLNESNATIFAYVIMDAWEPAWHIFDDFGSDRAGAFALDSLHSTHPCWAPVGHPDEVEERFDQITYEKGGSVEYQLFRFAGLEKVRTGFRLYMQRFARGNAEVTDLWDAIGEGVRQEGLDLDVRSLMDNWFLNSGHPVVTVSESDKPGFVKLHQERFQFLSGSDDGTLWQIPLHIRYATADGTVREDKFLFSNKEQEVFLGQGLKWVVANAGGSGFYRVRYSNGLLNALLEKPFETLQVIERFNLVNDSWALVRAQKLGADVYLGLVKKLAGENDPNVWSIISGSLSALHDLTSGEYRTAFKALIRELVQPVFNTLGWTPKDGESSATLELRGSLAALLGTVGEDAAVQAQAVKLFDQWKADRESVDPNVVPALVATVAYTGDKTRFDEFVALAKAATTDQEKLRFLRSLGQFRTPELYSAAIDMMLTEVKTDDAPFLLGAYLGYEHTGEPTWDFIRKNWKVIVDKFPTSGVTRMIGSCSELDTPELAAEVNEFFSKTKVKQGDMAVAQMLERLSVNVRTRVSETPKLEAFLKPATTGGATETEAKAPEAPAKQ